MADVVVVDTSILLNVLKIPKMSDQNDEVLARISHQAASRRQKSSWFQEVDRDANDHAGCRLRWPCPRGSFGPVRAHAPSTVGPGSRSRARAQGQNPPRSSRPLVRNAG